jgi:hypothetical protein
LQILQANLWVHQGRDAGGNLPLNGYNENWDSSVKAMTAYPDLLQRLTADVDWMNRLGSAYSAQPYEVLSAVQHVRSQANTLRSVPVAAVISGGR